MIPVGNDMYSPHLVNKRVSFGQPSTFNLRYEKSSESSQVPKMPRASAR